MTQLDDFSVPESTQVLNRRRWIQHASSAAGALIAASTFGANQPTAADEWPSLEGAAPKPVAGVLTTYYKGSHSDVLIGRLLEGWTMDHGAMPRLKLASLYIDQTVNTEFGRALAKKYDIPIFETIEGAVTVGSKSIAVDGVLSVGEHGDYPRNEIGQDLYPRRRFFEKITDAFKKYDRVVPVFNDKHLGPRLEDVLWMYRRSQEMKVPFMAGSSLVVGYRSPDVAAPMDCEMESAAAIGYSELDRYGIHTLEFLQAFVERRKGGECGVKWVQCLSGDAMWKAIDGGAVPMDVIEAAADVALKTPGSLLRTSKHETDSLMLFEYEDGFVAAVLMLNGFAQSISAAVKLKGQAKPLASRAEERDKPHYPHFAFLLHAVERMIHTGKPTYPIERTVLTSGILDRALTSRAQGGVRLPTPELKMSYTPSTYPHAPMPPLPV